MSATDVICSAFLRKTLETSLPTLHLHPLGPVVTTHAPPLPVSYVTHSSQLRLTGACPHHLTAPRTQDNDSRHNGCSPKWMDKEERWWPRATHWFAPEVRLCVPRVLFEPFRRHEGFTSVFCFCCFFSSLSLSCRGSAPFFYSRLLFFPPHVFNARLKLLRRAARSLV